MKNIKKAFIHYNNDPSVGMFPYGYEMEVNIENMDIEDLNEVRKKIKELYEFIDGESPTWVMFDKEIELQNKQEAEMDRQEAEYYASLEVENTWNN